MSPRPVGIALGSNQGNRFEHLQAAFAWLKSISMTPVRCSHVYETEPVDCFEKTPLFLNAVCEITCCHEPLDLLHQMRDFEKKRGRLAFYPKNAPRPLDLDLLYAGDLMIHNNELTLPHPRMLQRRFVLQPLYEIQPNLVLPGTHQSIKSFLSSLTNGGKVRLYNQILE